jgi:hypothetical protein|tara:strand:- start:296 stop:724 length:429 start_codon:yes stop_codon:yes gene_type:complete
MYLFSTITNIIILFIFQIILFKFLKFKKNWHITTVLLFLFIFIIQNQIEYYSFEFLNYVFFNFCILLSYIFFLTLIFNESPTLFYLNDNSLDKFINKGFIKNRIDLMIKDNLLNSNKEITSKGKLLLRISNTLSNIFFKEHD